VPRTRCQAVSIAGSTCGVLVWAIAKVVNKLRPLRKRTTISINGATQTFPPEVREAQRKIRTHLGINPRR